MTLQQNVEVGHLGQLEHDPSGTGFHVCQVFCPHKGLFPALAEQYAMLRGHD